MAPDPFEYDLALSFAEEDNAIARQLADQLVQKNIKVFLDPYVSADSRGKDVLDHLVNLYARKSRYVVLLVSRHYPLKSWTEANRTSVRERALRDADEYVLPFLLDASKVPGLAEAKGYQDLQLHSIEETVTWLSEKMRETEGRSRSPSRSHDLRSGNAPNQET